MSKVRLAAALALAAAVCSSRMFQSLLFFHLPLRLGGAQLVLQLAWQLTRLPMPFYSAFKDDTTLICEASALFTEHKDKAFNVRTEESDRAYVAACKKVFPRLDEAAKAHLLERLRYGALVHTLSSPPHMGIPTGMQQCAAPWSRRRAEDLEGEDRAVSEAMGGPPLEIRWVPEAEVGAAFERAEPVRFDASSLIPRHLFNTTYEDFNTSADQRIFIGGMGVTNGQCLFPLAFLTQMLASSGPGTLLDSVAKRVLVPGVLAMGCGGGPALRDLPPVAGMPRMDSCVGISHQELQAIDMGFFRQVLRDTNINVRRLPGWTRGELDAQKISDRIGLKEKVELSHSLLWMGATTGGVHVDIQDNLLVQVTGETTVFVVPPNCSASVRQDDGVGGYLTKEFLSRQSRDLPYFIFHMRPGDGLALPSNSMHLVSSRDPWRIDLNFFLEPRFGQMRWPSAPANFYTNADTGFLAMRALWLKTIDDLWQTGAAGTKGLVIHGSRQELV